jgi:hypothetical protein
MATRTEYFEVIDKAIKSNRDRESVCMVVNVLEEIFHENDDMLKEVIANKLISMEAMQRSCDAWLKSIK